MINSNLEEAIFAMFFTKPTFEEIRLPFRFIEIPDDLECGIINIEAYGNIFGKKKYCYAYYELKYSKMYHNGEFEQMVKLLKNSANKLDINSLVEVYNDERFKSLSLLGWGFNDKSYEELSANR